MQFIDKDMADILPDINPAAVFKSNGKIYGISQEIVMMMFGYNKKILSDNGLTAPKTWDDIISDSKIIKAKGIIPFVLGKECQSGWWFDILQYRLMGPDKIMDAFNGKISWTDAGFQKTAETLQQLSDAGIVDQTSVVKGDEQISDFANGKVAFFYDGSYDIGPLTTAATNPDTLKDLVFMPFPSLGVSAANDKIQIGGCSDIYFVSNKATGKVRDAAVAFVKMTLSPEFQKVNAEVAQQLPTNYKTQIDTSKVSSLFADSAVMSADKSVNLLAVQENRAPNTAYTDILRSKFYNTIPIKQITPQDFVTQFTALYAAAAATS
jgi:ABC-type glycerol-3-phosphate transport system substrate-binding protein